MTGGRQQQRLLMVMPYRQLVRKAKAEGFWVGALWDPALESDGYLDDVRADADAFALADFADDEALRLAIRDMAAEHDVQIVYHIGREESMLSTYETAELLHAEVNPTSAVRLLTDKLAMRDELARAGFSAVAYASAQSRDEVAAALDVVGYPAVVKPTALSGSRGVFLWRGPGDRAPWLALVDAYDYEGPFLVEEYLSGPEYSIETLSHDGVHQVIGITQKQLGPPPLFVELGHVHPAPLPAAQRSAIEELTTEFLTLCGYRFGPAHTEVIVTPGGPRLVESQARLGGDRIPRLIELTTGLDVERAIFAGLAGNVASAAPHTATAIVRFFAFPAGVVRAIGQVDAVRALPYVDELVLKFGVGDVLAPVRDSRGRHGHLIVSAASPELAQHRLAHAISLLDVVVAPADDAQRFSTLAVKGAAV